MGNNEVLNLLKIFLRKKHLYLTQARMSILETVLQHLGPFDADALWIALKIQRIGLSTIFWLYRSKHPGYNPGGMQKLRVGNT